MRVSQGVKVVKCQSIKLINEFYVWTLRIKHIGENISVIVIFVAVAL